MSGAVVDRLTWKENGRYVHSPGSNFSFFPVTWQGRTFPTVEHAYQWAKTFDERYRAMITAADSPNSAKHHGRRCPLRPGWDGFKAEVMEILVRRKFCTPGNGKATLWLLGTGDAVIVEGNDWRDDFFGAVRPGRNPGGVELEHRQWPSSEGEPWYGRNVLGQCLMKVRDEIRLELEGTQFA